MGQPCLFFRKITVKFLHKTENGCPPTMGTRIRHDQANFRLVLTHLGEAVAAENGTVGLGLEGNLGFAAAASAGSGEELTGATGSVLASVTAGLAALGLVLDS